MTTPLDGLCLTAEHTARERLGVVGRKNLSPVSRFFPPPRRELFRGTGLLS